MKRPEERLTELGILLPEVKQSSGPFTSVVQCGKLLFVSGHTPFGGVPHSVGKLGQDITPEEGAEVARYCALRCLATVRTYLGTLDRVDRVVRLVGYVNSTPDFGDHPVVIDGASNVFISVFGDSGRHTRCAVGVSSLPRGYCVEVEVTFLLKSEW